MTNQPHLTIYYKSFRGKYIAQGEYEGNTFHEETESFKQMKHKIMECINNVMRQYGYDYIIDEITLIEVYE